MVLVGCFSKALKAGEYGQIDAIWRLQFGLALVPAAALLYWRLTMPEGRKFTQSTELNSFDNSASTSVSSLDAVAIEKEGAFAHATEKETNGHSNGGKMSEDERRISVVEAHAKPPDKILQRKAFFQYFSEWRHLKTLIGTASTWFLLDIAFYGTNLNQSVLLEDIGFSTGKNEYETLLKTAYGNLIIAAAGYVPGYFFTIGFIEILGRKPIQIGGFLITSLMFGCIAGDYGMSTAGKFVCFTFAQFFFNFGPNATTFIIPGEVYPSRVRGLAHGFSAACGKLGAILAGVLFNWLSSEKIGVANTLWIFFACNLLGAIMTILFVPETKGVDSDAIDFEECQEKATRAAAR